MKRNKYILPLTVLALLSLSAQAQTQPKDTTVNRTVVVEQDYTPDIMDAAKVNVLPMVEEPSVSKEAVNYATTPTPASQYPATTMPPYMGQESKKTGKPGLVRLGYGNYGNLDVLGNYLFRITDKDKLNLRLQMDGMDGKINIPNSDQDWEAYYYRTRAGVDYLHQFKKNDLSIGGDFGLSNFNYLYLAPASKQKFTSGDLRLGLQSTDEMQSIQYKAEANLLFYNRQHDFIGSDLGEKILRTKADVSFPIGEAQRIRIDAQMSNVFLSGEGLDNYSLVEVNPAYEWANDYWKLHLGVHTDIGLGAEEGLHLAPDVTIEYLFANSYVLYAQATGGDKLNDFRRLESLSPYSGMLVQPAHTHERINAAIGFKASPAPGWRFDLFAGYQDVEDDLMQGLSNAVDEFGVINPAPSFSFLQTNTNNTYGGARLNYAWKDVFALQTSGTFRNWDADDIVALRMAPSFEFNLNTDIRPIPALLLNAGYQHTSRVKVNGWEKVSPISNLYLGGKYQFSNGIAVFTRINNLLNKEYSYYLEYPSQGMNFLGGFSYQF